MRKILLYLLAVLAFAVTATAAPKNSKPPTLTTPEPPHITAAELVPGLDGKEVTMAFTVENAYLISGSVPKGAFPSFGITPALKEGTPRFSVLVSGDLANLMDRFGMMTPTDAAKGRVIQATGMITVFPAPKNAPAQGPSYRFNIRDWKRFRIVPTP